MFGLFKKSKTGKSEEEKRAEALEYTKKVQFETVPLDRVEAELSENLRTVLQYTPVNYYATKDSYLLCIFYYNEGYTEIYMRFEYRVNDYPKGKTRLFTLDRELMRDILRKFGQNI